LKFII